jgi:phthalate 4,5-cis-dihydrodiol dehydrogenase
MERIGLGVVGLGRGFAMMRAALAAREDFTVVAGADMRPEARARLAGEFGAEGYATAAALYADPRVEAVYVATPHQCHAADVLAALEAGKPVLVEKPMALTLLDAAAMVAAAQRRELPLLVGHSHSWDAPVAAARQLIASGEYGAVRMIHAFNCTDFLYRPRRPEELDTAQGGGVFFNQAPHQVDIVRLLAGGLARSVRAHAGAWDRARPTEGAYAALIDFGSCHASLVYSGYAHFDSDALMDWIGETGRRRDPETYGAARRALGGAPDETALRRTRGYGGAESAAVPPAAHEHFGFVLAFCEHADMRLMPDRVEVFADTQRRVVELPPPTAPRREVWDAFAAAIRGGKMPPQTGAWGMATLEVCLAMLQSAREGRDISLHHQVAP